MTSQELVSSLLQENRSISELVQKEFSFLSFDDLNYHFDNYSWSPAECFDHLIVTNNQYIPLIENELTETNKGENDDTAEYRSTISGRFLLYSNDPQNSRKMKSPRIFRPEIRMYTKEVIRFFLEQNNTVYQLICKGKGRNLSELKINSPVTRMFRFNLGEAFRLINLHDQRHINQAMNALSKKTDQQ